MQILTWLDIKLVWHPSSIMSAPNLNWFHIKVNSKLFSAHWETLLIHSFICRNISWSFSPFLSCPFMWQFSLAGRMWSPFRGLLAFNSHFNFFQEMFNDSCGSNSGSLKNHALTMEGLFLVGSQKTEESFNEVGVQDNKEHGLCASTNSVLKKKGKRVTDVVTFGRLFN